MKCNLCPRRCNAERSDEENYNGFCQMPLLPRVARAAFHFWEEPCISGTNGSGAVFFSGCPLRCVYCQNADISKDGKGKTLSYQQLAEIFRRLEGEGAHNINLVTPTHYVSAIIKALDLYKPHIPIIYNAGGYESLEELQQIEPYVDVFLLDFKYLSPERAKRYSGAGDYPQVAKRAIEFAYQKRSIPKFSGNLMVSGLIIRHLLLPQGTREAMAVFDWVRQNTPNAFFSIMSQYLPCSRAVQMPPLDRRVTKREYEKVLRYICETDFENVWIQDPSSANKSFIPTFDLEGVK